MKNTHVKTLFYTLSGFIVLLALLAIVSVRALFLGTQDYGQNTISVSGVAEVQTTPDIAIFSFTVEEEKRDSQEAQDIVSEKISVILDSLEDADIDEKDITTQSYRITPQYQWVNEKSSGTETDIDGNIYHIEPRGKRIQTGFVVAQDVEFKVRDFDVVPDVLRTLSSEGVQNLYGPNFQLDDPEQAQRDARALAIADAREEAEILAKELGVRLGKMVSFSENNGGYVPYFEKNSFATARLDLAEDSFSPELPVGETTNEARVSIIYEIK